MSSSGLLPRRRRLLSPRVVAFVVVLGLWSVAVAVFRPQLKSRVEHPARALKSTFVSLVTPHNEEEEEERHHLFPGGAAVLPADKEDGSEPLSVHHLKNGDATLAHEIWRSRWEQRRRHRPPANDLTQGDGASSSRGQQQQQASASTPSSSSAPPNEGSMTCSGRRVRRSEVIYWKDADQHDRDYLPTIPSRKSPKEEQFLTFEYDAGGWNNIRMGVECMFVLAHYTGRTLVLPPQQSLYLISKEYKRQRQFGLADFLNVTLLASHGGWRTTDMIDFVNTKIPGKGQPDALQGRKLWSFVRSIADGIMPPVGRKFFVFPPAGSDSEELNMERSNDNKQLPLVLGLPPLVGGGDGGSSSSSQEQAMNVKLKARLRSFVNGRQAISYYQDRKLTSARHLHSPGGGEHRILMNFYAFAFFEEPRFQRYYRRFVRDYARYRDEIFCAADVIVRAMRAEDNNGSFYSIHARRNDFQYRQAKISAAEIIANLDGIFPKEKGTLVFLATDDPRGKCVGCMYQRRPCSSYPVPKPKGSGCPDDPSWAAMTNHGWRVKMLSDYLPLVPHLNPNYFGMVDQVVCARADKFAGTFWSTFSGYIHRLRGYYGFPETTNFYHTKGKIRELHNKQRISGGWMREWKAGWTDDDHEGPI